jgi:8-oxo-dGTP pyrophosphatase MutT (NUDIX family)
VLQREPRSSESWFRAGSILSNEEHIDASVRELFEEVGLILTVDDLTMLSNNNVRVPLRASKHHLVYVVAAYLIVPYITANLRTKVEVSQVVTTQSTINPDGTYVVPSTIEIDGVKLTPLKTGLSKETQRKFELLHFGHVAQLEAFRSVVISKQLFAYDDTSLPRQLFFFTQCTASNSGHVWMLVKGYVKH